MTRYATDEEKYECPECLVKFTLRESKNIGTNPLKPLYQCPCCNDSFVMCSTFDNGEPAIVWGRESLWESRSLQGLLYLPMPGAYSPFQ